MRSFCLESLIFIIPFTRDLNFSNNNYDIAIAQQMIGVCGFDSGRFPDFPDNIKYMLRQRINRHDFKF